MFSNIPRLSILLPIAVVLLTSCAGTRQEGSLWKGQVEDAKLVLPVIVNANRFYHEDYGADAGSIAELEEKEYLTIDDESKERFDFELVLENDELKAIRAVSKEAFVGGRGRELIMDVKTGKFSGELAR